MNEKILNNKKNGMLVLLAVLLGYIIAALGQSATLWPKDSQT